MFHQLPHDGQAQPRAAEASRGRGIRLRKRREEPVLHISRDAHAGVRHLEPQATGLRVTRNLAQPQVDASALGELERIAQQIHQHLTQPRGVAAYQLGHIGIEGEPHLQPLGGGLRAHHGAQLRDQVA